MRLFLAVVLGILVSPMIATAAIVTYSDSIPFTATDWSSSVSIPQFNPALGTLDSITMTLTSRVRGSIRLESQDAAPALVNTALAADVELLRPDHSMFASGVPTVSNSDFLTAYDGVLDFAGTSGRSYLNLNQSDSDTLVILGSDLDAALFSGVGNVVLPVSAVGQSTADGAGNLLLIFNTQAAADVTVEYNYTVPEPATFALVGLGALLLRRRR